MVWRGCVIANEDPARQASEQVTWPESWRGGDVSKGETTGGDGFGGPGSVSSCWRDHGVWSPSG